MTYQDCIETDTRPPPQKQRRYVGTVSVAARYDKSVRTVQRWLIAPPPGFPKPMKHHDRWLWDVEELDAYDDMIRAGR